MDGGSSVPNSNAGVNANAPPPFLSKTYDMVEDPSTDSIVSWSPSNNSFIVWNPPEFARDLLPKYFKHNNFSSFVRQLNTYGFRKVDPDRWEFANEGFLRGQKHLLKSINRRKPSHALSQPQQPQGQSPSVGACVEVGKFGLEEEIERLKRDKNVLMQELVRLRQQQQATDHQLQTLGQRLQGMEQRQQQMMSFLAKAMQSPGFLAQLVQQNDSNRRIAGVNKKRRLPRQEDNLEGQCDPADGQIVKYQPLMNEAAKAMLMQILKLDPSPRLEPTSTSEGFLIDNVPSSEALQSGSSSSRISGVTLSEVSQSTGVSYLPVSSGLSSTIRPSAAISEIQSAYAMSDMVTTPQASEINSSIIKMVEPVLPAPPEVSIPEFAQLQEMLPEANVMEVLNENFVVPDIDPMSVPVENFGVDTHRDNILDDDGLQKYDLPSINDVFWEQFLSASPISGDAEEVESSSQVGNKTQEGDVMSGQENGWSNTQHVHHITEQMGLLTSESKG
ncbi:heat stress transcription factor A-1-like [Aristolochia californica]|uniref:heat stress transcription factor A-1-like n=1 Tax=Aristolochia californica TaxID=171875 RepID=UPI0035E02F0F